MIDPNLMASIRQRAYEIWEYEGRPEGRERIHWLRAEAEFRERLLGTRSPNALGAKLRSQEFHEMRSRFGARRLHVSSHDSEF